MLNINKIESEKECTLELVGRLDTTTASSLETALKEVVDNYETIILDLKLLEYISSAGLRVILGAQKQVNAKETKMSIINVNEQVMEVFEITGFVDILDIN